MPAIQRKTTYDAAQWDTDFKDWQNKEAKDFITSDEAGTARAAAALADVKARTGLPVPVPQKLTQMAAGYRRITLWDRWGGDFGRLRRFLGPLILKLGAFYEMAREKFEALRKGKSADESESGATGSSVRSSVWRSRLRAPSSG